MRRSRLHANGREETKSYAEEYRRRDGIEGTISWAVRSCGLRRSRYRGLNKTHPQHSLTAAALNLVRVGARFSGAPPSPARVSPFVGVAEGPAVA